MFIVAYIYIIRVKKFRLINESFSHIGLNEKCISGILLEFDKGTRSCPCNVGCKETEYEVKISSAILPTPNNDVST